MNFEQRCITKEELSQIWVLEESHFVDFKSKDISPRKLSRTISAFANASGGDIYLGIREDNDTKEKIWEGFENIEAANAFIQIITEQLILDNNYDLIFLRHPELETWVLMVTVFKTQSIVRATDKIPYVRKSAQNLPCDTVEKIRRLELDKGIVSFEDEIIAESEMDDLLESNVFKSFQDNIVPHSDGVKWLKKQRLIKGDRVTVAGAMLFDDEPQILLPKRSAIKIYRYKTSNTADRDTLSAQPLTIEGDAYTQIYAAVAKTKEIIESVKILGSGFEMVQYPDETLHEIITNAVLHRDYSIATDIQIRIFDNRVEVESPGKLPGYVTVSNILQAQSARNPKIVRMINKFPNAPNKDVGEGLNTAFEAMTKIRLKEPVIEEKENSVLVIIKHERLASPEEAVTDYLKTHESITNRVGRELTGIKSENTMKRVFWKLRDAGLIHMIKSGSSAAWVKNDDFFENM